MRSRPRDLVVAIGRAYLSSSTAALAATSSASRPRLAWPVTFTDIAAQAGLVHPTIYGGVDRKRFIIETNGSGVALVDYDNDGWLDALVLSGTRLKEGAREDDGLRRRGRADEPPVSEHAQRHLRGRDRRRRAAAHRLGIERVRRRLRQRRLDRSVRDLLRPERALSKSRQRPVRGRRRRGADWPRRRRAGARAARSSTIDRDGRLDLFVANYLRFDLADGARAGQRRQLPVEGHPGQLRAQGPADRHEPAVSQRRPAADSRRLRAVRDRERHRPLSDDRACRRPDGDGWTDIYVASDSTAAILYRNNRDGTFTDIAVESGAAYSEHGSPQAGMGVAVGDYNSDGLLDLVKTHFADDIPALYRNLGKGLFEDAATAAGLGVQNRYVEWGAGLPDFDNDGLADLVLRHRQRLSGNRAAAARSIRIAARASSSETLDGVRFEDVTAASGAGAVTPHSSRGAAFGDVDNDGDVDVLVMNMNEPPSLLRNDYAGGHGWIEVELEGRTSNRSAIGATVIVTAGGRRQARAVLSQSSYYSHDDLRAALRPRRRARVDEIEVRWPSGQVQTVKDVEARRVGSKIV